MPAERRTAPGPGSATVRVGGLFAACLASLALGLAGEFAWRWFAVDGLDVSGSFAPLRPSGLLIAALVPVVGNGLGYAMSHRRPSSRSRLVFVGPSPVLTGVGLAVSLARLPPAAGSGAVAVTVVLVLITPAVVVTVLLTRRNILGPAVAVVDAVPPAS